MPASLLVMNFPNLTRFFIVRRAEPSTTGRDRNDSPNLLHAGRGDTWVDNFIRALDVATALGAVFPPLKATTQTLNVILKDYQDVRNNIANLQGLVTAITELLTMLNNQIRSHGGATSGDSEFMQLFYKFNSCLSRMKDNLDEILKKSHKSFGKRMLYKDPLSRLNADYVRRMDDLRLNFLVQLGLDTRRFIASGRCEANGVFEDLDTSDYHKYKIADIHSIESLPTEDQIDHDQLAEESLVKIDGKADIFTFRRYIGSYALATFRKEFETFSRYKHAHIRQIFGVCESKLTPGILFRGKLLRFLDYSTRDEACSVWSWISFVNGSKIVAPYFRRHLKSYLSDSVYPQKRYGVLIDYHDVYIDIGTDDHLSVWSIPEPNAITILDVPVLESITQLPSLSLQRHISFVLRQRTLPVKTDIRDLLAGFYDTMETMVQYAYRIAIYKLSTPLPLPLLNANEVYVIMGAHGSRNITFGDNFFSSGAREKRQPWRIWSSIHPSGGISVDLGEWTRFTVARGMTIKSDFDLPRQDCIKAFRALLPQLRRILDGNCDTPTFELVHSLNVHINIRRRLEEDPNRPNKVYCFIRNITFSQCGDLEIYWSTDQNGESRMEKAEVDCLGLTYIVQPFWGMYRLTDAHLNAIKVFHDVCGYGGEDGEERLLSLFDFPRAQIVSRFKGTPYYD